MGGGARKALGGKGVREGEKRVWKLKSLRRRKVFGIRGREV